MKMKPRLCLVILLAILTDCSPCSSTLFAQQVYPAKDWAKKDPEALGFDATALQKLIPAYGIGGVIIRHGYVAASWGNPDLALQTASMGKAFTGTVLGLAVDAGMVKLDDPVWKTWTGEGQLNHRYKDLNYGEQANITWRDFTTMSAGFPDLEGVFSPGADMGDQRWNYSRRPPGEKFEYSDAGMWRCSQALTSLWGKDIKEVFDQKIFSQIGVPADRWDWMPGQEIHDDALYPGLPGYGSYLDPPWEINGHAVRGGPGWVVISANDLARFGYLMLRHGRWLDKQLISDAWTRDATQPHVRMNAQLDYGLNWWIYRGGKAFAARGISLGWSAISSLWVVPDSDLVVAFIRTNLHTRSEAEALRKNDWDEQDFVFQVAEAIKNPER
jgi:CubicO group peptidase (beta-lactamase class C family)